MINVIVILMECITMWLCLHIAFGEKIKKSRWEVLFFVVYLTVFVFSSYGFFSRIIYFFQWVFIFFWCKKVFKRNILNTLIRTISGIVAVGVIETISIFIYSLFVNDANFSISIECVVASLISVTVVCALFLLVFNKKRVLNVLSIDKNIFIIIIFIALFLFYVKLVFEVERSVPILYVFFFNVLSLIFILLCRKQKNIFELEKKNLNLELQNMYGNAYDDLLKEVRRKQHDYKNQLTAVYSMYSSAKTLEELKGMQEKYLGILQEESEVDSILTKCNNPILAGYLYNVCLKYKTFGIKVDVDVIVENSVIDIKTKYIIEILGVLLDNAYEKYVSQNNKDKRIYLKLYDKEDKLYIEVGNVSEYFTYEMIEKMFKKGYSTKGQNRGIGLWSVKNIVNKYNGEICVENVEKKQMNWIVFRVTI